MITDRQRDARSRGLGSSDMAAIFGISRWKSPLDVWAEKTGKVAQQEGFPSEAAMIGSSIEPALLEMAGRELGRKVVAPTSTFVRGVLRANVDGMLDEFKRGSDIVEAKTHGQAIGYGVPGTDAVPEAVRLQVQHQMLCAESKVAYVAVLDGQHLAFKLYRVEFDEGYAAEIEHRATEFWEKHVVADVPPPGALTLETASRMNRIEGTSTHIPQALMEAYVAAREAATEADKALDQAKAALLTALGQAEFGVAAGWRVSYKLRSRAGFDTKRLLEENKDLATRYATTSSWRVLDVRPEGGSK